MLDDKTYIAQIGLNAADLRLVETVFKLSAELKTSYALNTGALNQGSDIVLVNADSEDALDMWQNHSQSHNHSTLIKVVSDSANDEDGILSRPLSLKKLMSALESATSTEVKQNIRNEGNANTRRVLVVDDSFAVRKYMEQKLPELSPAALIIEYADSGEAAIEKFNSSDFDIVFLDVVMPGKDGYQVCKWIKSERNAYVVMLTSKKSPFDKVRGNMSGCNAYITKPPQDAHIKKVLQKGLSFSDKKHSMKSQNKSTLLAV